VNPWYFVDVLLYNIRGLLHGEKNKSTEFAPAQTYLFLCSNSVGSHAVDTYIAFSAYMDNASREREGKEI
jgi:hypothetical protein